MKRALLKFYSLGILTIFGISGCSMTNHKKAEIPPIASMMGIATQVGKLSSQQTPIKVSKKDENLVVLFPELKNNMGKNFEPTPCEIEFSYKGDYENPIAKIKSTTYFAQLPKMNNNCALYLETRSAQYGAEKSPRFLTLEEDKKGAVYLTISRDILSKDILIRGELRKDSRE